MLSLVAGRQDFIDAGNHWWYALLNMANFSGLYCMGVRSSDMGCNVVGWHCCGACSPPLAACTMWGCARMPGAVCVPPSGRLWHLLTSLDPLPPLPTS
jgi:hypothetical protein